MFIIIIIIIIIIISPVLQSFQEKLRTIPKQTFVGQTSCIMGHVHASCEFWNCKIY